MASSSDCGTTVTADLVVGVGRRLLARSSSFAGKPAPATERLPFQRIPLRSYAMSGVDQDSFDEQFAEVVRILGRGLLRLAEERSRGAADEAVEGPQDPLASGPAESVHGAGG